MIFRDSGTVTENHGKPALELLMRIYTKIMRHLNNFCLVKTHVKILQPAVTFNFEKRNILK